MKVNDTTTNGVNLGLDKALTDKMSQSKVADQKPSGTSQASAGDNVTISSAAQQLSSIESASKASPAFDAEKVSAIKTAIQNGEFQINTEKVADGLIQSVKDLLDK